MDDMKRLNDRQSGLAFACGMVVFAAAIIVERVFAGARFDVVDAWIAVAVLTPQLLVLGLPIRAGMERERQNQLSATIVLANGLMLATMSVRHTVATDPLPYMVEMLLIQTMFCYVYSGVSLRTAMRCGATMGGAYLVGLGLYSAVPAETLARTTLVVVSLNLVGAMGRFWSQGLLDHYERARHEMAYAAEHDPLTDLLNRRGMRGALDRCFRLARREKLSVALIYIDVDHFKGVNDHSGHDKGDRVLMEIAAVLRSGARRPLDAAIRMGGDEFLVAWLISDSRQLLASTEAIRSSIGRIDAGDAVRISASIGLLVVNVASESAAVETLINRAESLAMQAKSDGGDRIRSYGIGPQVSAAPRDGQRRQS